MNASRRAPSRLTRSLPPPKNRRPWHPDRSGEVHAAFARSQSLSLPLPRCSAHRQARRRNLLSISRSACRPRTAPASAAAGAGRDPGARLRSRSGRRPGRRRRHRPDLGRHRPAAGDERRARGAGDHRPEPVLHLAWTRQRVGVHPHDRAGVLDKFPLYYDNYFVPRGYAFIAADAVGTAFSTGCPLHGGPGDVAGFKAVIDWLMGRTPGYDTGRHTPSPRAGTTARTR